MNKITAEIASIEMAVEIDAPPAEVWQALTEKIGDWWPEEFYAGGNSGQRTYLLEAKPGGRMYEDWQNGGGLLWATVITVEPEKSLQVLGHLFPNWGGPAQWYGSWTLASSDSGTRLEFSECALGKVSETGMREKDKGWMFLWNTLKAKVEGNEPPQWQD